MEFIGPRAVQTRMLEQEERELLRFLREGETFSAGAEAAAFEQEFSVQLGCGDSVAVCNATASLELAAALAGIGPGDEVILPAHTFVSSAVPFARVGARLKWADIEPQTRLISAATVEPLITAKTRALLVVHLYGLTANTDALSALAEKHGLVLIEDCAQALGARFQGKCVGTFGHFACFSFHSQKNITTLGEGGILAVRDKDMGRNARRLRWMGNWPFDEPRERYWQPAMNDIVEPPPGLWPFNFCMGEPNCAVGRLLIRRLDRINELRQQQAKRFQQALRDVPELHFQEVAPGCEHVYNFIAARYDGQTPGNTRDSLIQMLADKYMMRCTVQFWPLNRTQLFRRCGFGEAHVPETDRYYDNMICFPWWTDMGDALVDDMAERIRMAVEDLRAGRT